MPTDKGANAGSKVASLVAGMVAGADCIDDMALLRHGGMGRVFARAYAPSTLGSFLRAFTFGHVRQLDAVASRFLAGSGRPGHAVASPASTTLAIVDVDDTVVEVHGYAKQGAGFGYYPGARAERVAGHREHQAGGAGDRGAAAAQGFGALRPRRAAAGQPTR